MSLGILDDPAAAASKKAAAAARSQRSELLQRVPWMAALKGIRSPLLRLHQGACWRVVDGPEGGCHTTAAGHIGPMPHAMPTIATPEASSPNQFVHCYRNSRVLPLPGTLPC